MSIILLCRHVIILLGGWVFWMLGIFCCLWLLGRLMAIFLLGSGWVLWMLRISIWLLDDLVLVVKLTTDNTGRVEDGVGISEESSWVGLDLGKLEAGASVRDIVGHFETRGEWTCQAS